jgi:uncharacterized protein YkwD
MDVRRNRWLPLVFAAIVVVSGCSGPTAPDRTPEDAAPTPPPVALSPTATEIVDLTNAERTRAGLAALRANARLTEAARLQAEQLATAGRLEHVLPDARHPRLEDRLDAAGYRWQAAGENLAFGQRTAAALLAAWMDSAGHRANILHTSYTEIGVAHLIDPNGRPYYVQVFARPRP